MSAGMSAGVLWWGFWGARSCCVPFRSFSARLAGRFRPFLPSIRAGVACLSLRLARLFGVFWRVCVSVGEMFGSRSFARFWGCFWGRFGVVSRGAGCPPPPSLFWSFVLALVLPHSYPRKNNKLFWWQIFAGGGMSSFLRFCLTKRFWLGIIGATGLGKPTDGADYAEPIKWVHFWVHSYLQKLFGWGSVRCIGR